MKKLYPILGLLGSLIASCVVLKNPSDSTNCLTDPSVSYGISEILEGKNIFRYDTFGDEVLWTDKLKLHQAIEGKNHGGVGPGVSPKGALAVGLKVDSDSLPTEIAQAIKSGSVNLEDPAVTLTLFSHNAVVGVKGVLNQDGKSLKSIGIQCALCHSNVDNSFSPGIGRRLDGWANRDLDVGAIINLSQDLSHLSMLGGVPVSIIRATLKTWGPGRYDAHLFLDGKAFRPDGKTASTLIPPAFGLLGVNLHTYTGFGSVPYWNAFVAVLLMGGKGNFYDPRLEDAKQFPLAARNGWAYVHTDNDLVTSKLPALHAYQLSLAAPKAPKGSYSEEAAARGRYIFNKKATCSGCHVPPIFTDPGFNMTTGDEIGIDDFQSDRSPEHAYRTTPLAGLWSHQKGGFYHDGRFKTLMEVVNHYNTVLTLGLTETQKSDLVEYLKSL